MAFKDIEETGDRKKIGSHMKGFSRNWSRMRNSIFILRPEYPAHSGRHVSMSNPKTTKNMIVVSSRIKLADVPEGTNGHVSKDKERFLSEMRYVLFRESSFRMEPQHGELESMQSLGRSTTTA